MVLDGVVCVLLSFDLCLLTMVDPTIIRVMLNATITLRELDARIVIVFIFIVLFVETLRTHADQ